MSLLVFKSARHFHNECILTCCSNIVFSDSLWEEDPPLEEGRAVLTGRPLPTLALGVSVLRALLEVCLGAAAELLDEGCNDTDFLLNSFPPLQASLLSKGL